MTEAQETEITSAGKRRRWPRITALTGLLLIGLATWCALGLRGAATDIQAHATGAQTALRATQAAVAAGDFTTARQQVALARREVDAATAAADAPQVRLLGVVPVLGGATSDLDHMISAASTVTDATTQVVDVYGQVTGKEAGVAPLFAAGKIDLARLQGLSATVAQIDDRLAAAENDLGQVRADLPGTSSIRSARDSALADVTKIRTTVATAKSILPLLPKALGAEGPKRYLVAILNQGELRAGGGAPLSVALVTFTDGAMTIPLRGSVAELSWPNNGQLSWEGAAGSPWNDSKGGRKARFTASNVHPDFRSSGFDMVAAWNASGFPRVDGVIALDVTAIASVLRHTGPITTKAYGKLTADNLGQTLLIDAYRKFATDPVARRDANQAIVDAMLTSFTTGSSLVPAVRGLVEAAPGRHTQFFVVDPRLEAQLARQGLDGALTATTGDQVAVFSRNVNASKVDVFQNRAIEVKAMVAADGSATVTQRITITNATPESSTDTSSRTGYTTTWSEGGYNVYRPAHAFSTSLTLPEGFAAVPWANGGAWIDDGHGHSMMQALGWLSPRAKGTLTLSYQLPAGTFLDPSGAVVYTLRADPQPTYQPATVTVHVNGPSGLVTTQTQTLDHPVEFVVAVS